MAVIYLSSERLLAASSPSRLLSTSDLGEPPSLSVDSEIAAGRITLFTPVTLAGWVSSLLLYLPLVAYYPKVVRP